MYRQLNEKAENITFGTFIPSSNRTIGVPRPPELENCFGWRYFEYSFIISVTDSRTTIIHGQGAPGAPDRSYTGPDFLWFMDLLLMSRNL